MRDNDSRPTQWCLVGNIVDARPYGEGGHEIRRGTKHFSPGTKVYCLPPQWGDGYEQIVVIGRHRGSKRLTTMIVDSRCVTNWRAKVVYQAEVLRRLQEPSREFPRLNWRSKEEVEAFASDMCEREREEAERTSDGR